LIEIVTETLSYIEKASTGGDTDLLGACCERGSVNQDSIVAEKLISNIKNFSKIILPHLPNKTRIATMLTQGFSYSKRVAMTDLSEAAHYWGQDQFNKGEFKLQSEMGINFGGLKTKCNLNISSSTYLRERNEEKETLKYTPKSHKQKDYKSSIHTLLLFAPRSFL